MSTTPPPILPATGTYALDASPHPRRLQGPPPRCRRSGAASPTSPASSPSPTSRSRAPSRSPSSWPASTPGTRPATATCAVADFFDVETYPTMTFRSTGVREVGEGRFDVDGELTVRGITKPLTLHATFDGAGRDPWGSERVGFTRHRQGRTARSSGSPGTRPSRPAASSSARRSRSRSRPRVRQEVVKRTAKRGIHHFRVRRGRSLHRCSQRACGPVHGGGARPPSARRPTRATPARRSRWP